MTQTMEPAKNWKEGCKIYLERGGGAGGGEPFARGKNNVML